MEEKIKELVSHLKDGDYSYFDEFYNLTKNQVFYMAFSILKDHSLSEDILQETYISFLKHIKRVKIDCQIMSYLLQIAKNLSLNLVKKRKKEVGLDWEIKDEQTVYKENIYIEKIKKILRDDEFMIVILHVINELPHREIAKVMKKPLGTVTWAYKNALEKIRKVIGDE